jgi:hypothetical protein
MRGAWRGRRERRKRRLHPSFCIHDFRVVSDFVLSASHAAHKPKQVQTTGSTLPPGIVVIHHGL